MIRYLTVDLGLFLCFVLVMIIVMIRMKNAYRSYSSRLFLGICWSSLALLALDSALWLLDGSGFPFLYATVFLFYLAEPVPLILWLCYMDYHLNGSAERLRRRWYYSQPLAFVALLLLANLFSGIVYRVDGSGLYSRGPAVPLIMAADLSMILYTFFSVFRARKRLERKAFAVIVLFGILPLSFGILQIAFSGLPLLWNSVALAVIFVYIFMETQKEIRDYLTGLPNRQQIDDMIVSRMMDAERKGGFSLIMLDMDGFKAINDQYGHKEGDRALVRLAEILKRAVKGIDKVARFGGDEFMILLEDGRAEKANEVIKRLQDSLEAENASGCRPYALSVSAGFSVYSSTCGRSFHDLVNSADQDMYMRKQAKARGRSSAP